MASFKALFGECIDCNRYLDIAVAEIEELVIVKEKNMAQLVIKPYRKIDKARADEVGKILSDVLKIKTERNGLGVLKTMIVLLLIALQLATFILSFLFFVFGDILYI